MTDSAGFDWSIFDNVRVQFWMCPVDHPRYPPRVTVEWDSDVATCTDCGRTNKDREPQPSDGPEYHADHAAWEERRRLRAGEGR